MNVKKMFVAVVDACRCRLLAAIGYAERLFPLVPTLGPEDVDNWQSPEVYYFLDNPSPCVGQRLRAVLTLDREAVSFWRKRQQLLKIRGWESVTINQHVS